MTPKRGRHSQTRAGSLTGNRSWAAVSAIPVTQSEGDHPDFLLYTLLHDILHQGVGHLLFFPCIVQILGCLGPVFLPIDKTHPPMGIP